MKALTIRYPDDLHAALDESPEDLEDELRFLLALKLFELRKISSGKAAQVAGMGKIEFLDELGRRGIPVLNLADDELEKEFEDLPSISSSTAAR